MLIQCPLVFEISISIYGSDFHLCKSLLTNSLIQVVLNKSFRSCTVSFNIYLKSPLCVCVCIYIYISRIRRNLSIHIARFSVSESLRVYPNIYKNSPPFASSKGVPQVGFAMRVRERESASYSIILSLLALRADVSILARALFYLFLPFILISHLILL